MTTGRARSIAGPRRRARSCLSAPSNSRLSTYSPTNPLTRSLNRSVLHFHSSPPDLLAGLLPPGHVRHVYVLGQEIPRHHITCAIVGMPVETNKEEEQHRKGRCKTQEAQHCETRTVNAVLSTRVTLGTARRASWRRIVERRADQRDMRSSIFFLNLAIIR
jgi:hypothetical protein